MPLLMSVHRDLLAALVTRDKGLTKSVAVWNSITPLQAVVHTFQMLAEGHRQRTKRNCYGACAQ